jgi:hypothetical protein
MTWKSYHLTPYAYHLSYLMRELLVILLYLEPRAHRKFRTHPSRETRSKGLIYMLTDGVNTRY